MLMLLLHAAPLSLWEPAIAAGLLLFFWACGLFDERTEAR